MYWKLGSINTGKENDSYSREWSEAACLCITNTLKIITKMQQLRLMRKVHFENLHYDTSCSKSEMSADGRLSSRRLESGNEFRDYIASVIHTGTITEQVVGTCKNIFSVYNGPDYALSQELFGLAKLYSVPIMISEQVYYMLGECMKKQCRKIDIVKASMLDRPVEIFSMDISAHKVKMPDYYVDYKFDLSAVMAVHRRRNHALIKEMVAENLIKGAKNLVFFEDPDI